MNIIDTNATAGTEDAATSMTNITDIGREKQDENTAETTGTNPAVNELDAAFEDSCEQAGQSITLETQSEAARRRALADLAFILVKDGPHLEFVGKLLTQRGLEEKYKARTSAALVRISFGFKQTKEKTEKAKKENQRISNTINRYANVIDACVEHFGNVNGSITVDVIAAHIEKEGIDALAKSKAKLEANEEPNIVAALATLNPMGTFELPERLKNRSEPFTLVVVPSRNGTGNIVLVQSGDDDLMRKVVDHGRGYDLSNVDPAVNLLSEVSFVTAFIPEPDSAEPTQADANPAAVTTKFLPATRMTMFCYSEDGWSIRVSNMRMEAGPVVHVAPTVPLTIPANRDLIMDTRGRKWFEDAVAPESRRGRHSFRIEQAGVDDNWDAEMIFTTAKLEKEAEVRKIKLIWQGNHKADPIDVDLNGLKWDFTFNLDGEQLAKLRGDYLAKWAKLHKSKTRAATLDMTFSADGWKLDHHDSRPITFGIATGIAQAKTFRMKGLGQHWNGLFRQLEELELVGSVEIAGAAGLWRVTFQTALATYSVYLPTVLNGKGEALNTKRFATYSSLRK